MKNTQLAPIKPIPALVAVALTLIIWFIIPTPEGVSENAWQLLALFVGTIAAIIGKALPIGAISIISISLVAITGVTNPGDPKAALGDALSGFSNELIWLIGISIMISMSLTKTGLGARIGYDEGRVRGGPLRLLHAGQVEGDHHRERRGGDARQPSEHPRDVPVLAGGAALLGRTALSGCPGLQGRRHTYNVRAEDEATMKSTGEAISVTPPVFAAGQCRWSARSGWAPTRGWDRAHGRIDSPR